MKRTELKRKTPLKAKKGLNKVRKTSKSTMKRKADKLFSEKVRSVGICELQGIDSIECNGGLQCAHIIGRANHNLRWNWRNALSLCQAHHLYYTHQPWEWQELIKVHLPIRYEYLNEHRNEVWDKNIEKVLEDLAL